RSKRIVHWLRLAGSAPLPRYFEIAEPEIDGVPTRQMAWRGSARVLVVDEDDRVLLFRGRDPTRRDEWCWFPPGGGVRGGERPCATATRELAEQTGLRVDDDAFCGPVWLRRVHFFFHSENPQGTELFFLLRTNGFGELDGSWSARSKRDTIDEDLSITIDDHRWLTVDEYRWFTVDELVSTSDTVYPEQLTELLPELLAGDWDGQLRTLR
ncbi:MAG: NUDIX domain-containing protein, partial [Sciscionella sp.]|nr:NUDIX domain-containing protein [Sciscionella sp.]